MFGRAGNLYFETKYKNISTRKFNYRRAVMRIKECILYGHKYAAFPFHPDNLTGIIE